MKFSDGVTLETERLFIRPLDEEEMKNLADSYIEIKNADMTKQYTRQNVYTSSATSPITRSYELALEQ